MGLSKESNPGRRGTSGQFRGDVLFKWSSIAIFYSKNGFYLNKKTDSSSLETEIDIIILAFLF